VGKRETVLWTSKTAACLAVRERAEAASPLDPSSVAETAPVGKRECCGPQKLQPALRCVRGQRLPPHLIHHLWLKQHLWGRETVLWISKTAACLAVRKRAEAASPLDTSSVAETAATGKKNVAVDQKVKIPHHLRENTTSGIEAAFKMNPATISSNVFQSPACPMYSSHQHVQCIPVTSMSNVFQSPACPMYSSHIFIPPLYSRPLNSSHRCIPVTSMSNVIQSPAVVFQHIDGGTLKAY
jgi:hypothetical protein